MSTVTMPSKRIHNWRIKCPQNEKTKEFFQKGQLILDVTDNTGIFSYPYYAEPESELEQNILSNPSEYKKSENNYITVIYTVEGKNRMFKLNIVNNSDDGSFKNFYFDSYGKSDLSHINDIIDQIRLKGVVIETQKPIDYNVTIGLTNDPTKGSANTGATLASLFGFGSGHGGGKSKKRKNSKKSKKQKKSKTVKKQKKSKK